MSWLGDSFTSLTGHLSTLTKEVLSEGREEVGDYLTELSVANKCIRDLEGQYDINKQELERIRKENTELEERCQAAELQINSISSQYRSLLQSKEDEISRLKRCWQQGEGEVTPPPLTRPTDGPERGYGYHSDEADVVDLISQQEINKLASEVRRLRAERDRWRLLAERTPLQDSEEGRQSQDNNLNGHGEFKIQSSIEALEERLQETIDEHQNQLTILQEHYTSQLFKQQEQYQKEIALLNEQLDHYKNHAGNDAELDKQKMQEKYVEGKRELEESKKEIECMKLEEKEKDRKLRLLTHQLEKLQTEKLKLEDCLETTKVELSDLHMQWKEAKTKYDELLSETAAKTSENLLLQKENGSCLTQASLEANDTHIAAQKRMEELKEENEKVCNDTYAIKLRLLAQLEAHHATTAEVLEDIQAAKRRIKDETLCAHIRLLHEKENILDLMQQANERKLCLQSQINSLQKSSLLLTSDIREATESLGNIDSQEYKGILESLTAEKDLLKEYNDTLYNCLLHLDKKSSRTDFEDISENDKDNSSNNSRESLCTGNYQNKYIEHSMKATASIDDFDQMSLTSSMSELSLRNRELDIQVKGLQQQIETYEREIEHFEFVRADWQAERQAMEDLLLNLRAKLRMKEESLSVAMAKKGLIAVKKKYPEDTQLSLLPEESEDLDGEGMLETVVQQIEELTQSNAQLENEKEVLWAERSSLLEEVSTLRSLNQQLNTQLNEIAENGIEEEDKNSSREELAFSLEESLAEKETEILTLIHEKQSLEESLDQLDQQHQEEMAEVLSLKENLAKANKQLQHDVCELREIMATKEEENLLLKTEVETIQEQLTSTINASQQISNTSKASPNTDGAFTGEKIKPLAEMNVVGNSSPPKEDTIKSIVDAFHTINSDNVHLEEEIISLEESRKQLETKLEEMQQRNEKLILENKKLVAELRDFRSDTELSHLKEGVGLSKEAKNAEAEKYLARIAELQRNLNSSENQIENLSIHIVTLKNEKEALQKELNDAIELHNKETARLKCSIKELDDKYISLVSAKDSSREQNEKNSGAVIAKVLADNKETVSTDFLEDNAESSIKDCSHSSSEKNSAEPSIAVGECHCSQNKPSVCDKELQTTGFFSNPCNKNIQTTLSLMEDILLDSGEKKVGCASGNGLTENKFNETNDMCSSLDPNNACSNTSSNITTEDFEVIVRLENVIKEQEQEIKVLRTKLTSGSPIKKTSGNTFSDNTRKFSLIEEKVCQLEIEKEQMLSIMTEKSKECSSLKSEVHRLINVVSAEKQALSKVQQDNQELLKQKETPCEEMTKEAIQNLCRLVRDKDLEIEALGWKNNTLLAVIQQSSPDTSYIEEILKEQENLMKQLGAYKSDREQIINVLNQKHQESLTYHAEVQRLKSLLSMATSKLDTLQHHHESVSQQYEEKQKSLVNTQNEVISLKQRVSDLERQQMELEQKHSEILESRNCNVMANITKEDLNSQVEKIEKLQNSVKEKELLIFEKDQLIHELSQDLQKQLDNLIQKENEISILHRQTENLVMYLKDTKDHLNVAKEEDQNAKQQLGNVQSEVALMKELNERLSMTVQEREFEIKALQEKVLALTQMVQKESTKDDTKRILTESDAMQQRAQQFHHERDEALLALSQRQQESEELKNEVQRVKDRENRLNNELERLREHLLQVEESYTKEALNAEEREKQLRNRLSEAEEQARMSSTAIHNASQLANSQVESLQEQLVLIARQRDKALSQVSEYEDQVQQYSASLGNLQLVLEQFQKEREREMQSLKKQHQEELQKERQKIQELIAEVWHKEEQLAEATEAIDAASRLSEKLDTKEDIIATLRNEVSSMTTALQKTQEDVKSLRTNTEGKVDRQVMKSLVLGYFSAPLGQKPEVIRLLARVLDFNQEEMSKAGIRIGRENLTGKQSPSNKSSGWISGWFSKADSQQLVKQKVYVNRAANEEKSFSALFVQFLQNESQPQHNISLPAEEMAREMTMKSAQTRPSRINPFNPLPQHSGGVTPPSSPNKFSTYNSDHPLICPLSSSLPSFTPVLVASDATATTSNTFLQEVLK